MQERQVKEQQIEYAKKILKIQEQLKTSLAQVQYTCFVLIILPLVAILEGWQV